MQSENEAKLRKIRRVSIILRAACKACLVLVGIGLVLVTVSLIAARGGSVGYFDVWFRISDLSVAQRMLVLGLSVLTSAVWCACLYALHQLFGNYSQGQVFTRGSVRYLRLMGITCVLWGVVQILWMGLSRALSAHSPASVQVSAEAIPIGVIVLVVAWFMDIATDLQEENELTV